MRIEVRPELSVKKRKEVASLVYISGIKHLGEVTLPL